VLKVTPVRASASAASTRMDGVAELWHRRFHHLGLQNLKRVVEMVDGMPASVADAKRILGTVCVPCVDGRWRVPRTIAPLQSAPGASWFTPTSLGS